MSKNPGDEDILFINTVHPEHDTMTAYGWVKRDQELKLQTNSDRRRLNLHGAINAETFDVAVIESETVDAESTITIQRLGGGERSNRFGVSASLLS